MADTKITALSAITTVDPANDVLPIVDVSDTSMAASGTTKKITTNQLLGASGTATLASATISGAATVGTTLGVTGVATFAAGTALLPALTTTGDTNTGIYYPAADTFAVTTGGSERFRIDTSGNVGIGVTPSAWAAGYKGLQIKDSYAGLFANTSSGISELVSNAYNDGAWKFANAGNGAARYQMDALNRTHAWFYAATSANPITWTQAMTLDASGNLGIGVTPSAIAGQTRVELKGSNGAGYVIRSASTNTAARDWVIAANVTAFGDFVIRQGNSQGAEPNSGTDRFYIDPSGNTIFTISPTPPTLTANGQLTVNATSNTNLRFSYRGSDGVTRTADITLA